MLTTTRPDIVIWSVKAKKVFVIELTLPYEENFDWAHQRKLEKYWGSTRTMCQKWLDNKSISYRSRMQRFYCQLNLRFLN